MSEQLEMFPAKQKKKVPWQRRENLDDVRHCGSRPYKPGTAKKEIITLCSGCEWVGAVHIFTKVNMATRLVSTLLDRMAVAGVLEETKLYYMYGDGDRTIKPPPKFYRGFQSGFRLVPGSPGVFRERKNGQS